MDEEKQILQELLEKRQRHLDVANARHRRIREAKAAGTAVVEKVDVSTPERIALANLPRYSRLTPEESRLRNIERSRINYRKNRDKINEANTKRYHENKAELKRLKEKCV